MYHFNRIINHQGPLTKGKNPDIYQKCKYNVRIKWTNGDTTSEPLNRFVKDSPQEVAKYIFENRLQHLLQEKVWGLESVKGEVDRLTNRYPIRESKRKPRSDFVSTQKKSKKTNNGQNQTLVRK